MGYISLREINEQITVSVLLFIQGENISIMLHLGISLWERDAACDHEHEGER